MSVAMVTNVSAQNLYTPVKGGEGKVFAGILVKAEFESVGIKGSFSFKYPYFAANYADIARRVAERIVTSDQRALPNGVSDVRIKGL